MRSHREVVWEVQHPELLRIYLVFKEHSGEFESEKSGRITEKDIQNKNNVTLAVVEERH